MACLQDPSESAPYEPQPRNQHAVCEFNGKIYIIGGQSKGGIPISTAVVNVFDTATLSWQWLKTHEQAPSEITYSACTVVGEQAYLFGGEEAGTSHSKLIALNLVSLCWEKLEPVNKFEQPSARSGAGLISYDDQLILYGGHAVHNNIFGPRNIISDIHIFNLKECKWTSPHVTGMLPPPLRDFTFTLVGKRAVLFGGRDSRSRKVFNDVYILDLIEWLWSMVTTLTAQLSGRCIHAACALSKSHLLITGGANGYSVCAVTFSDAWVFNLQSARWSEVEDYNDKRDCHAAAVVISSKSTLLFQYGGYRGAQIIADTAVLELTHSEGGEEWRVVDYVTTSNPVKWKERVQLLHRLGEVQKAMKEKKSISSIPVSLVLMGTPRSGKSTILRRLIEGVHIVVDPKSESPSTPLAGEPVRIEIKRVSAKFAIVKEKKWIKHGYSGEKQLLVSYFLQKVPLLPQVDSKPDAILVRQTDHLKPAQPAVGKSHSKEAKAIVGHNKSKESPTVDCIPVASLEPVPVQQQPSSDVTFESPQDILHSGMQGITNFKEAEEDLEGSMMLHILDTGGQPEFLDVLPAILSGPSLSLLVFKLTDVLGERYVVEYTPPESVEAPAPYISSFTLEEFLVQAYTSVSHHAPPHHLSLSADSMSTRSSTLLVGTHKDCVSETKIKEIDEQLLMRLKEVKITENQLIEREQCPNNPNVPRHVFAVDNTKATDPGLPDLQEAIAIALEKHFSKLTLPIQWLMLYLAIKSTKKRVLSLEQCRSIASSCDITNDHNLKLALWYLSHQFGVFRYYPDVEGLQDTIICDLQVLFDCITNLIKSTCYQKSAGREESDLRQSGRCSAALLHKLLCGSSDLPTETAISLLEHLQVISCSGGATTPPEFFVPCILKMFPVEMITATQKALPSPLLVVFERGYCPLGLFSQLMVYLTSTVGWKLGSDVLFRNIVTFHVGDDVDKVTLIARPKFYEILFEGELYDTREHPLHDSCSEICKIIDIAINVVKSGLNSTIQINHIIAFYCPRPECYHSVPHPAISCGKRAVCSVTKEPTKYRSSQLVWFEQTPCSSTQCSFHPVQVSSDSDVLPGKYSMDDVVKELAGVRRWFNMGLLLGLSCSTLVKIKSKNQDNISGCRKDVISCWLQYHDQVLNRGGPTVKSLTTALRSPFVDCSSIASIVEQRFGSTVAGNSVLTEVCSPLRETPHKSLITVKLGQKDIQTISKCLSTLSESHLQSLGMALGLYLTTIRGYGRVSVDEFRMFLLADWINEKDNVMECGEATWSSLVKALRADGVSQNGIAATIEAGQMGGGQQQTAAVSSAAEYSASQLGNQPTLPKLLKFECKEKIINVPRQIGDSYIMLGITLLQDDTGERVDALEKKYQGHAEHINLKILREWMDGQGLKPVTWGTLIEELRVVGLERLADDIEEGLIA